MDTVQICKDDQEHVFSMVAAVLWLGNISFNDGNSGHVEVVMDEGNPHYCVCLRIIL